MTLGLQTEHTHQPKILWWNICPWHCDYCGEWVWRPQHAALGEYIRGKAVRYTLCTCCYQVRCPPLLWKQLSLCLCSVWDVMVPPTVLESIGYQYYWFCRAVADRACSVIGVQGRWISSSISSELRIVSRPHAAVDASVAGYLPPKVLSMTVYYCSVPLSTVIVFPVPPPSSSCTLFPSAQ